LQALTKTATNRRERRILHSTIKTFFLGPKLSRRLKNQR
jgi:hypothetical protein